MAKLKIGLREGKVIAHPRTVNAGDGASYDPSYSPPAPASVEDALARAIEGAVVAGKWDVVSQLARELEARRLAAAGAVDLAGERARRSRPKAP